MLVCRGLCRSVGETLDRVPVLIFDTQATTLTIRFLSAIARVKGAFTLRQYSGNCLNKALIADPDLEAAMHLGIASGWVKNSEAMAEAIGKLVTAATELELITTFHCAYPGSSERDTL